MSRPIRDLFARVDLARDPGDSWCSPEKAATLAAIVVALRPSIAVEIGVWRGASVIPILLAMDHVEHGRAIAIDPWNPAASVTDEIPANAKWWGTQDHDRALADFKRRIDHEGVADRCEIIRARSDDAQPPDAIDLLHVDGSHTQQAVRDVERFASRIGVGGVLVMDDLAWDGDGVRNAHELALRMGFRDLYPLGTGVVMRRVGA